MDNEEVAHEHSDVDVRTILAFGVGMAVVVAASFLLMWGLFRFLDYQAAANDPQRSPVARPDCPDAEIERCSDQLQQGPRLLINEPEALAKFRALESKSLEGYGWANEQAGVPPPPPQDAPAGTHGEKLVR
jgi:hypothetical protein